MNYEILTWDNDFLDHPKLVPMFFGEDISIDVMRIYCYIHHCSHRNLQWYVEKMPDHLLRVAAAASTSNSWEDVARIVYGVSCISDLPTDLWVEALSKVFDQEKAATVRISFLMGLSVGLFRVLAKHTPPQYAAYWYHVENPEELRRDFLTLLKRVCTHSSLESGITVNDVRDNVRDNEYFMEVLKKTMRERFIKDCSLFGNAAQFFEQFADAMDECDDVNIVGKEVINIITYARISQMEAKDKLALIKPKKEKN